MSTVRENLSAYAHSVDATDLKAAEIPVEARYEESSQKMLRATGWPGGSVPDLRALDIRSGLFRTAFHHTREF